MDFYTPNRDNHGSFFFDWGTEDEKSPGATTIACWMAFVNDYKNRGGRVTVGSDSGFIYQLYGFGTIQELELLREAGFHPLEVLRSATLNGAQALGAADSHRLASSRASSLPISPCSMRTRWRTSK